MGGARVKFLHIADLHLGKRLNGVSFLEDQIFLLNQISALAEAEHADAVVIAGDVYQKASPQSEAMAAFDAFVTRLAAAGIRVLVISGNHDSAQRISYFSALVRNAGVYVSEEFTGTVQTVALSDAFGEVRFGLLPFLKPIQARRFYPDEKIETYEDAVRAVLRHSPVDPAARNVLVCHQFVTGAETCDSEETAVGGLDCVDASAFDDYDYVALGHIHGPQRLKRDTLRYAGSLMKYSFSEVNHRKSVTVVEMLEKGDVRLHTVPLTAPHDMRTVEGMLSDVMAMPYSEDYVWVTIHDELPPPDARVTISTVFPNMLKFSVVNSKTKMDIDVLAREQMESKSVPELFSDFYRLQNNDVAPSERHIEMLTAILKELEGEVR